MSARRFLIGVLAGVGVHEARATVRSIVYAVAERHGIDASEILSAARDREIAWPRQEVMYLARKSGRTYPEIGRVLKRDHTSIIHGVRAYAARYGLEVPL